MAETTIYGADVQSDRLFLEDPEAAEAAREIKAWLAASEPSKALITCERMLSLHPGDRLFEGLRLEVESKDREVRLDFIRRLSAELEKVPDLDERIESIRQALHRYPSEAYLSDLLDNALARRDLFNAVIHEARSEENSDGYDQALKRWYLLRELFPSMPGLENEIRRVETLAETQKKLKRRAEFVDLIFQLSSTGQYNRALYQCINALSEYPNDGGLIALKKTIEEKAERGTELQRFVSDGVTFLQAREIDAALECFGKAKAFDQSNLQVRYLIGIALLEKARLLIQDDRRKLNLLLNEAKSFMPDQPELQTVSLDALGLNEEPWETSIVPMEIPAPEVPQEEIKEPPPSMSVEVAEEEIKAAAEATEETEESAEVAPVSPAIESAPEIPSSPPQQSQSSELPQFASAPENATFQRFALVGMVILVSLVIGVIIYANLPNAGSTPAAGTPQRVDIKATPEGAEIFVDDRRVGESQAQAQLSAGNHTVSARLAGYEPQAFRLEVNSEPKSLQIALRPILMEVHVTTDQPGGMVWVDDQPKGTITELGLKISGVEPGIRMIRIQTPRAEVEFSLDFQPGRLPLPTALPPRQIANVVFAGSVDGQAHVECNCAPAGLRVGELAEIIRPGGLALPLDGPQQAELWMGKSKRKLTIHGSRSPVATIAVFSNLNTVAGTKGVESSVGQSK